VNEFTGDSPRLGDTASMSNHSNALRERKLGELEMSNLIVRFFREEDGMEFVEWALVATLFALAGITAWQTLASNISTALTNVGNSIN
jgi:Flp pilus assembly pilin Flp